MKQIHHKKFHKWNNKNLGFQIREKDKSDKRMNEVNRSTDFKNQIVLFSVQDSLKSELNGDKKLSYVKNCSSSSSISKAF